MNVYKTVKEIINGIEKEFVLIEANEYYNYMLHTIPFNKKIIDKEIKNKEKEEKQNEIEAKRLEQIEEREKRLKQKEEHYNKLIEQQIIINKHHNEKIKKVKEDLRTEYSQVFQDHEDAKISKCDFCKTYRVYPTHYLDENDKPFLKEYTKDKKKCKSMCCMDCFHEAEQKKEDVKINNTEYCPICQSSYIALTENAKITHINSIKHQKNKQNYETKLNKDTEIDLTLLSIKELQSIVSNSVNENGYVRINNYTRLKKIDLIEKMNAIYDLLIFP